MKISYEDFMGRVKDYCDKYYSTNRFFYDAAHEVLKSAFIIAKDGLFFDDISKNDLKEIINFTLAGNTKLEVIYNEKWDANNLNNGLVNVAIETLNKVSQINDVILGSICATVYSVLDSVYKDTE